MAPRTRTVRFENSLDRNSAFGLVRPELLAFTYMGTVLLLVAHNRAWLQRLSFFGVAGRMALTNYIMHSVVTAVVFCGFGFGLFGKLARHQLYYVVFAIWAFQLIVSPIWLRYYYFGPLEWLWRSLTYRKRQPMRIRAAAPAVEPAIA